MDNSEVQELLGEVERLIANGKAEQAKSLLSKFSSQDQYFINKKNLFAGNVENSLGNVDEAKKYWSLVDNKYDFSVYAWAQLNLGNAENILGNIDEAEKYWSLVDNKHDLIVYAWAQLNLGNLERDRKLLNNAKKFWLSIEFSWNISAYEQAQIQLSILEMNQGNTNGARMHLEKVNHLNHFNYADAQLKLGFLESGLKNIKRAKYYWETIEETWNSWAYAGAQFQLGLLKYNDGNRGDAAEIFNKLQLDWNSWVYANAKYYLGVIDKENGHLLEAKKHWESLKSEWNPWTHSMSLFELGLLEKEKGDIKKAEEIWDSIDSDINAFAYMHIQYHLGNIEYSKGEYDRTINYWKKINRNWNVVANNQKERHILEICDGFLKAEKYELVKKFLESTEEFELAYHKDCLMRLNDMEDKGLIDIYDCINNILSLLQINDSQEELSKYCGQVAHYTSSNVALKILDDEKASSLRLSSIEFMNDPTEGKLMHKWLKVPLKENIEKKHYGFASCFSFNHDSLNQFRLYGKQNAIEATGVSLIIETDFFSKEKYSSYIGINQKDVNENVEVSISQQKKYPIYRCIYINPEIEYFKIAQRSEYTFYKGDPSESKEQYNEYSKATNRLEKKLKKLFLKLQNKTKKLGSEIDKRTYELLDDLLLPLKYLIKHPAFEEEQECRMVMITSLNTQLIQKDYEKKFFYIDYDIPIKDHIKKIYLSEGAKQDRVFFEYALTDSSKVEDSTNPFRIK